MKHIILSALALSMTVAPAFPLTVDVTPGGLSGRLQSLASTSDATVKLTGSADVRDLALLKDISGLVSTLDMSDLKIVGYTYPKGNYYGRDKFAEGELPPYVLAGSRVENIILPSGLKSMGEASMMGSKVKTVTVPASVKEIGSYAFASCPELTDVTVAGEAALGTGIFKECPKLTAVSFKYDLKSVPASMLDGCSSYTATFPTSVRTVGDYAYRGTALSMLNLTQVESVGAFAFAEMPDLTEIYLSSENDTQFGTGAFFHDTGLETLPIMKGSSVPRLGLAQNAAKSMNVINAREIGEAAYANNPAIDTLTLGPDVRKIAPDAFRNLTNLKLVDVQLLKNNIPEVDENSFSGLLNHEGKYDIALNVEDNTDDAWKNHPVWSLFKVGHYDVGVADVTDTPVSVNISREGSSLYVTSDTPIDYAGVFTVSGMKVAELMPRVTELEIPSLPSGEILIVKVLTAGLTKIVKIR